MTAFYSMLAMSRQNVSQKLIRIRDKAQLADSVVALARQVRDEHPAMGVRKMYLKGLSQLPLGRDQCEEILLSKGFRVEYRRNFTRTTYSIGKLYFPNLIPGMRVDGINQLWQTDITYYEVGGRFYYLVFILDVYSRKVVGWSTDYSMWAEANRRALRQAIRSRGTTLKGLIHHSDRGGQYIDKAYLNILTSEGIRSSMCKNAWENAFGERINGIIKNEYLKKWKIRSFDELSKAVNRAVKAYNDGRPHNSLPCRLSPSIFEEKLGSNSLPERPQMRIYETVEG